MVDSENEDTHIAKAAIEGTPGFPAWPVFVVRSLDRSIFDHTYLAWVDEQIELAARGAEWAERLRRRREGLTPWVNVPLVNLVAEARGLDWSIKIDPRAKRIVHWETYDRWSSKDVTESIRRAVQQAVAPDASRELESRGAQVNAPSLGSVATVR